MVVVINTTMAQERTVTGTVTSGEDGSPLPGVNVILKGTSTGTITDVDGNFLISVSGNEAVLTFSSVGFTGQELLVGNQTVINLALQTDITALEEIVITGYGSQIKRDVTGSISQVKSEELKSFSTVSADQALQGLAAGVQVIGANGVPGAPTRVMIRGTNSISSGTEPLWIIDGMILSAQGGSELDGFSRNVATTGQNPLASINPNDIESIEVLKDAMATSIYGSRGAGGVIIVTTKSGKKGQKGTLNIDYQQGVSDVVRGPEQIGFVDGDTWLELADQARANSGLNAYDPNSILNNSRDPNAVLSRNQTVNTNYFDEALRQGSFTQLDLSTSRGSDNASYFISGQYRNDEGVLTGNNFNRYSLRTNLDFQPVNNLEVGLRATFAYTENERAPNGGAPGGNSNFGGGGYDMANSNALPWLPIFHPTAVDIDGNPLLFDPLSGRNLRATMNRDNYINNVESFRTISVAFAEWTMPWIKGLSLRSELGYDYVYTSNIEWANTVIRQNSNYAFDFSNTRQRLNYNIYGTYNKRFAENHEINVVGGFERTTQIQRTRNIEADQLIGTAKEIGTPGNVLRISAGEGGEIYFQGMFARLNYKFMDRYLFGLSYRYDGSSIFQEDNRYGSFPAVSAGWIISDEAFMSGISFVNFLKVRGSIGQQGNSSIDPNATLTTYATWGRYGNVGAGDLLNTIGNNEVTWETQTATDIAADFELLESRISGSIGYYNQKVEDMLYRIPIPQSSGIFANNPTIWGNIGDMRNWGMELQLNAILVDKGDFRWDVGFNLTTNKNTILKLSNEDSQLYNAATNGLVTGVGNSIGFFRLARYAGIHPEGGYELIEEMDLDVFAETGERVATGNLIPATRANMNRHLFDNEDKTNLPTYFGGFNTSVAWKGIDFSMNFSYQGGNYIFDNAEFGSTFVGTGTNVLRSDLVDNTWSESNKDADWPELTWDRRYDVINDDGTISANQRFDNQRNGERHDKFLKKGDFIRLRGLVLGYSLPKEVLSKIGLTRLRVYGMANNLLTITGYDGYDPEVLTLGGSQDRNIQQGWVGIQLPQLRSYSVGINIGF